MDNGEKLIERIASGKISKNEVRDMHNATVDEADVIINSSRSTKSRKKIENT